MKDKYKIFQGFSIVLVLVALIASIIGGINTGF